MNILEIMKQAMKKKTQKEEIISSEEIKPVVDEKETIEPKKIISEETIESEVDEKEIVETEGVVQVLIEDKEAKLAYYQKIVLIYNKLDIDHSNNVTLPLIINQFKTSTPEDFKEYNFEHQDYINMKKMILVEMRKSYYKNKPILKSFEADLTSALNALSVEERKNSFDNLSFEEIAKLIEYDFTEGDYLLHLPKILETYETFNIVAKDNDELINSIVEKWTPELDNLDLTKLEELQEDFINFDERRTKENYKNLTNLEFKKLKQDMESFLKEKIAEKKAEKIANDLNIFETPTSELDKKEEEIKKYEDKDFLPFGVKENEQESVKNQFSKIIQEEKERRTMLISRLDYLTPINSKIETIKEIELNQKDKKPINVGKTLKVKGYVLIKDNQTVTVYNKEDIIENINNGFDFIGYETKGFGVPKNTIVAFNEVKKKEKKNPKEKLKSLWDLAKKHPWKAIAILGATLFTVVSSFIGINKLGNTKEDSAKLGVSSNKLKFESLRFGSEVTLKDSETKYEISSVKMMKKNKIVTVNDSESLAKLVKDGYIIYQFGLTEKNNPRNVIYVKPSDVRVVLNDTIGNMDDDIVAELKENPKVNISVSIDDDARIYKEENQIGNSKGQPAYYGNGTEKVIEGYVFQNANGGYYSVTSEESAKNLINKGQKIIGVRVINEHSKTSNGETIYEGFFDIDDLVPYTGQSRKLTK